MTYLVTTFKEELVWILTVIGCTTEPGDIVEYHRRERRVSWQDLLISSYLTEIQNGRTSCERTLRAMAIVGKPMMILSTRA